jgi:hypothetical protein|nr:MAG TPA: hypothetical protein [Caudoviricetes sp.]
MNYFDKLSFKDAEKLRILLREFRTWLSENCKIENNDSFEYGINKEFEDKVIYHFGKKKIIFYADSANKRNTFIKTMEYGTSVNKIKPLMFKVFIRLKGFKSNNVDNKLRIFSFAITKNKNVFPKAFKYALDLRTGKFFYLLNPKCAETYGQLMKDYFKSKFKEFANEELEYVYDGRSDTMVIFKNKDIVIMNTPYAKKNISIHKNIKAQNIKKAYREIKENKRNIIDIGLYNTDLVYLRSEEKYYFFIEDKIYEKETKDLSNIKVFKNGINFDFYSGNNCFYDFKKEKDFFDFSNKNVFVGKTDMSKDVALIHKEILYLLKNNAKIKNNIEVVSDFEEDSINKKVALFAIYENDCVGSLYFYKICNEIFLLSSDFLSKNNPKELYKIDREILLEENNNNLFFVNL